MKVTNTEKKVIIYTAVFIAISLNIHKLLSLFPAGKNVGIQWNFNWPELIYQTIYNFVFCFFIGYLNFKFINRITFKTTAGRVKLIGLNLILFLLFLFLGLKSQLVIFQNVTNVRFFVGGYILRFMVSAGLMGILIKILLLYRNQKLKDVENEKLKTAYFDAQIANLRAQINPHFLFNSLTNLSALIREKPVKAQEYVTHLSKVFRYSLSNRNEQVVELKKELGLLHSNIELLKMRLEDALIIHIDIADSNALNKKIPYMSLPPLLENAVKHNLVSLENPLYVDLILEGDNLLFKNTIKEPKFKEPSTGIGLLNINERYKLLFNKEIEIQKTATHFIVKLPLI
ncbi:sensor histidine kinase [Lutibacter sp. B1]|uniref:sensor histidine kinase n=1 Tax=Lutibacter sp. B1 TaxID=2725996 RepID=UPI00145760B8|nr:histidine kinase [Lutibacter sp. B1]NLP58647.1 histidine kinase [Lutibacter sp. B1]